MSLERVTVDRLLLPPLLLDSIKAHCRVEFDRDDALLKSYIASAINLVELKCDVSINPAEYIATGDELHASAARWALRGGRGCWSLPVNNVHEFTVFESSDPAAPDLSAEFELWSPDFGGAASSYLVALAGRPAIPFDALVSLMVGIDDAATLAPGFFGLIARLTASMYENREASVALWAEEFNQELAALSRGSV
jgi:hypothetical protein